MKLKHFLGALSLVFGCYAGAVQSAQYSASFKNTEISEFINTVGKNLHKNMIVDPSIKGKINIRSYDVLDDDAYYQFFLSVLELYGLVAIPVDDHTVKVVKVAKAKAVGYPLYDENDPSSGSEMIARVFPVQNISVKELSPLLRQMVDLSEGGNVVHYEPSNVLIITGRANVVNRIVDVVKRVDKAGDQSVDIIKVKYASAAEIARLITSLLNDDKNRNNLPAMRTPKIEADERSNSIVVSGEPNVRKRVIELVKRLDQDQEFVGNTKVIYLKYAKAKNVVEVLNGLGSNIDPEKAGGKAASSPLNAKFAVYGDEETNSVIVNAQPDLMQQIESVITKLDIRRAQVYVEAIIVEMSNSDAAEFGVQWGNTKGGAVLFNSPTSAANLVANGFSALGNLQGGIGGFYSGNWFSLVTALKTDARSNVLSTPSVVTLDNEEAEFTVGQEVPVLTGSQSSLSSDANNVYQTIERKTVGTKLKFTPQINEGDSVILTIEQEVSSVASTSSHPELGDTFDTRTIKNSLLVKSGETVVLGGLLNESTDEVVYKVPILGDIPLLGYLFKYTSANKSKRNLMVFIHPIIIRDPDTYSSISRNKYTKFRSEQLDRAIKGVALLPDTKTSPIMPVYGKSTTDTMSIIHMESPTQEQIRKALDENNGGFVLSPEEIAK
ncbi:MAG: type II secretion system secretin GspD [Succinivibrionaceae bacterium]|jgi:general secretion pathway protein D|nr:type II secretion system secretin GspD [Succinivibrionaceae bacterium]